METIAEYHTWIGHSTRLVVDKQMVQSRLSRSTGWRGASWLYAWSGWVSSSANPNKEDA